MQLALLQELGTTMSFKNIIQQDLVNQYFLLNKYAANAEVARVLGSIL
jgi:hypothetical protein